MAQYRGSLKTHLMHDFTYKESDQMRYRDPKL